MDSGLFHKLTKSSLCKNLYELIEKYFDYLFKTRELELLYFYEVENHPYCEIIFELPKCRLGFVNDRDVPEFYIGTKSANFGRSLILQNKPDGWYEFQALIDFIEKKKTVCPRIFKHTPPIHMTLEQHIVELSGIFKQHYKNIYDFIGGEAFNNYQTDLLDYLVWRREEFLRIWHERYPGQLS